MVSVLVSGVPTTLIPGPPIILILFALGGTSPPKLPVKKKTGVPPPPPPATDLIIWLITHLYNFAYVYDIENEPSAAPLP